MQTVNDGDILENEIFKSSPELLKALLKDHTTGSNIFWATSDYESLGEGYEYSSPILPELITGSNGYVIMPRVLKHRDTQSARVRDMAEVFTPSWICNAQNNLIDNAWFGHDNVFNSENDDHTWTVNAEKVEFHRVKTWKDYVRDTRLEITCGEAPYLVSRYDTTTGSPISLENRIGLLDRKLRVVSENTATEEEWIEWAQEAYKSVYAYEWQGDNLLIARENLLMTFVDYYRTRFDNEPITELLLVIADIISWNLWQMDGLKGVVPDTCYDKVTKSKNLLGEITEIKSGCPGCSTNNIKVHNGKRCLIRDWDAQPPRDKIRFIDLINP